MGLPKIITPSLAFFVFLCGCQPGQTTSKMSKSDQKLLEDSLKAHSTKEEPMLTDSHLSFYNVVPSDLKEAISSYRDVIRFGGMHDYDYLQELAVRYLKAPDLEFDFDPEIQLLSVFGASISKNEKLLPIFDKGILSEYPQVQLASVRALAEYPNDQATKILLKGLQSNYLEICFETVYALTLQKHPESMGYIQGLMNKVPEQFHFLFPMLYATLDTPQSAKMLLKFFQHKDPQVRIEAILSAAKMKRHDLVAPLKSLAKHHEVAQQEAAAYALGQLQDTSCMDTLTELSKSSLDQVALAAHYSLYQLGQPQSLEEIERYATEKNLFAIALLRDLPCDEKILEALMYDSSDQVRLNAALSLLKKKNPLCLPEIRQVLIPKDNGLSLTSMSSSGKALSAKKWVVQSDKLIRSNPYMNELSDQIRREILMECIELPENVFLSLANDIIQSHQSELIPTTIGLMQNLRTQDAIDLLKNWQQKVGYPFVRAYSNLALFQLGQPGPWKEQLLEWIHQENAHPLIRLRPMVPWNKKTEKSPFELSAEEKSQLLIESYLSIALQQEEKGLDLILSQLANPKSKNKYILAGILIKATE